MPNIQCIGAVVVVFTRISPLGDPTLALYTPTRILRTRTYFVIFFLSFIAFITYESVFCRELKGTPLRTAG